MSAPVRIEAEAWSDLRFATLARILGFADLDHALIKVSRIWSWQTEHYTPDAPTYVVDADLIDSALGTGGAQAMVRSRLAEEEPGGFRVRGSKGRIEWLWQRRQASRAGGEARKRSARNESQPGGSPPGKPGQNPGPAPKPSPLVPALVPEIPDLSHHAHAIPPAPAQEAQTVAHVPADRDPRPSNVRNGAYNADDPRERGRLAERTYRQLSDARIAIARELGLPDQLPFPAIGPSSHAGSFRDLQDRIREEGSAATMVCERVIANLIAQAREERSIEWLAEKACTEGGWRTARAWMPAASRPAKAQDGARRFGAQPAPLPLRRPDPPIGRVEIPPGERAGPTELAAALKALGIDRKADT